MTLEVTEEQYKIIMCALSYTRNRYATAIANNPLDAFNVQFHNELLVPVRETIQVLADQKHED